MKCSPKYHNEDRQEVGYRPCNKECFHWEACLKELKIDDAVEDKWTWTYPIKLENGLNTEI